jgi:hypothetical protein
MRLIHPLLPSRQPHLPVAYPVSTDEALTPESQRDNCYISTGGNAGTHRACPEALTVATLPLDLASNQLMGILIDIKVSSFHLTRNNLSYRGNVKQVINE